MRQTHEYGPYEVGDSPVITATCTNEDGVLTNPTTITFIIDVNGVETSYVNGSPEVENPSVGVWKCRPPAIDRSAPYQIRCVATGAVKAADQTSWSVIPVNT